MTISLAETKDAEAIAIIHKAEIRKGFLSTLPISFLNNLYKAVIASKHSFCLVAKEDNEVVGFISGVTDLDKVYLYFLKKHFFQSCAILLPRVFSTSFLKKIFETLWYPVKEKDMPKAELLTMAVSSPFHGQGIAGRIFTEFVLEMQKRGIKSFKVLVGEELKPAVGFYEKHGFRFIKKTAIHGKSISRIYIYDIKQ